MHVSKDRASREQLRSSLLIDLHRSELLHMMCHGLNRSMGEYARLLRLLVRNFGFHSVCAASAS